MNVEKLSHSPTQELLLSMRQMRGDVETYLNGPTGTLEMTDVESSAVMYQVEKTLYTLKRLRKAVSV